MVSDIWICPYELWFDVHAATDQLTTYPADIAWRVS